jgi:hypothetical protein
MKGNMRSTGKERSVRTTVRGIILALALGALLGSALTPCSRWLEAFPLLCTALQSAFSAMMLAVLAPIRSQDLSLGIGNLPMCSERGNDGAQQSRISGGWCTETGLGLVAL